MDFIFKPVSAPQFWSTARIAEWLADANGDSFRAPAPDQCEGGFLPGPKRDERTHVSIDPVSGAASEHLLFVTVGLVLPEGAALAVRVRADEEISPTLAQLNALHPTGGERRLARWRIQPGDARLWQVPSVLCEPLKSAQFVRMILVTPALFARGWRPGWLGENLVGSPPGCQIKLRLVGAIVGRWQPVSGWSLEAGRRGPKPVRRMAPAGSTYFFEVLEGDPAELAGFWLESVSDFEDDGQDRKDGFGLAVWGLWGGL